ncbi:MAG: hypothetical protein QOI01_504 [Mycobacterium sp.]|jgi:hypothetical protein|nr:hypothetical protein [Mycobacterium sp.]
MTGQRGSRGPYSEIRWRSTDGITPPWRVADGLGFTWSVQSRSRGKSVATITDSDLCGYLAGVERFESTDAEVFRSGGRDVVGPGVDQLDGNHPHRDEVGAGGALKGSRDDGSNAQKGRAFRCR